MVRAASVLRSKDDAVSAGEAGREGSERQHRPAEQSYEFGTFRLLPDRQLLLRAGTPVRIGGRALDILTLLVRRAGELVSKAEIEAHAWPGLYVHESNLKVHVAALRKLLQAGTDDARCIVNVPGRGYRFILPVTVEGRARLSSQRWPALRASVFDADRIVGREEEIASLAEAVSQRPLVTVTGAGGVGKTTVALAAAERLSGRHGVVACFVDLSAIDDAQLVVHAIAGALGIRVDLNDLLGGIGDHLRATSRLLLLDNCEQVSAAVAAAAGHLASDLGRSALLVTSREPLRARQEHVFRLSPLSCPDITSPITAAQAQRFPAVALFVARAHEQAGYVLSDDDAAAVAAICRRLDGLPLAIELAATRLDRHRPAELLQLLQDSFSLLSRNATTAPARQRTLLATLDWSYRLLSEAEARILRFAAIFVLDFTLDDLVAILGGAGLDPADIVTGIENLVAKSFVLADLSRGSRRYRLFESSRSYAMTRLNAAGERDQAYRRLAEHLLAVLERAEREWQWRVGEDWIAEHGPRSEDLRRALAWAFGEAGDSVVGIRLTVAAIPLWEALASVHETTTRVKEALDIANGLPACDVSLKTKLASSRAWSLTFTAERLPATAAPWIDGLHLARDAGDTEYQLRALWGLATYEMYTGKPSAAIGRMLEFESIAERAQDWSAIPDGRRLLARLRAYVGEVHEAGAMLERLALRFDRLEKRARITRFQIDRYVGIRNSLAFVRWLQGQSESATTTAAQAVDAALAIDHAVSHCHALAFAAVPLALWSGDLDRAAEGVGALRDNPVVRSAAIWRRHTHFFEAALRHAHAERAAVDAMGESLDDLLETGFVILRPMYLAMLADALLDEGRVAEAQRRIDDAIKRSEQHRERWCRAELLRVQGRVQAANGNREQAHVRFAAAIAEADALGTRTFELRASCALARSLEADGQRRAARAILEPVCAKFPKDSRAREVISARALLKSLA